MASFCLDRALETTFKGLKKCGKLWVAYLIHKFKTLDKRHKILLKSIINSFRSVDFSVIGRFDHACRTDYSPSEKQIC